MTLPDVDDHELGMEEPQVFSTFAEITASEVQEGANHLEDNEIEQSVPDIEDDIEDERTDDTEEESEESEADEDTEQEEEQEEELQQEQVIAALKKAGFDTTDDLKIRFKVDGEMREYTPQEVKSIVGSGAHNLGRLQDFRERESQIASQESVVKRRAEALKPAYEALKKNDPQKAFFHMALLAEQKPQEVFTGLHDWALERVEDLMGWERNSLKNAIAKKPEAQLLLERESRLLEKDVFTKLKPLDPPKEETAKDQQTEIKAELDRLQSEYGFTRKEMQETAEMCLQAHGQDFSIDQYKEALFTRNIINRVDMLTNVIDSELIGDSAFYAEVAREFDPNGGFPDDAAIVAAVRTATKKRNKSALKKTSTTLSKKAQTQGQAKTGKPRQNSQSKIITFADIAKAELIGSA